MFDMFLFLRDYKISYEYEKTIFFFFFETIMYTYLKYSLCNNYYYCLLPCSRRNIVEY
jgi:hypothetical protein